MKEQAVPLENILYLVVFLMIAKHVCMKLEVERSF